MKEVKYTLSDGKERIGSLVKENIKTAVINPYRWIKSPIIKVHKIKNLVKIAACSF